MKHFLIYPIYYSTPEIVHDRQIRNGLLKKW
jgi:hypothetical protein